MEKCNKKKNKSASRLLELTLQFLFIDLFKKRSVPQIFVLLVDTLICVISYLLVLTFNPISNDSNLIIEQVPIKIIIVAIVYVIVNLLVKNYKYTIRLPIIEDMYRTLELVVLSSIFIVILTTIARMSSDAICFSLWDIFVANGMAFMMMICIRLITKHLYSIHIDRVGDSIPVILVGDDLGTLSLAHMIKNEQPRRYNPVAIMSTKTQNSKTTTVNGFRVIKFSEKDIDNIFAEYNCNSVLIPDHIFSSVNKDFIDFFLRRNIKLYMLNHVTDYLNQTTSSAQIKHISIEDLLGRNPIKIDKSNLKEYFQNKTVLVTGAAGSIGSEITRQVIALGAKSVLLVDQAETPMHSILLELNETYPNANLTYYVADITNINRMEAIFAQNKPNIVLHAAAYKHVPMMEFNPLEAIHNNILGTKNIADLSVKYSVEKFVMVSTDKAVNPTNIMGATKRAAEIYVQSLYYSEKNTSHTQFITTRFGNVLGSNGSVIPLFKKQIEQGGPITLTHKDIIRYFMTIDEACTLVLEASCIGQGGEIFIFDMGTPVKIYDLAVNMITLAGLQANKDIKIVETGLRSGEKLYEELLYDKETCIPTTNKKIMRTKIIPNDYSVVSNHISLLRTNIEREDEDQSVIELKRLVPEYKSQNSRWEQFDK